MRALGRDIVELFGYAPDDISIEALHYFNSKACPFVREQCTKSNHDQTEVYGTCAVSAPVIGGVRGEVITCPKRLYASDHKILSDITQQVWGKRELIVGGSVSQLRLKAAKASNPVVAFGHNSGREIQINSNGQMSMDWVLQSYRNSASALQPREFVGVEVQSIDTTGNYRSNWNGYAAVKRGTRVNSIPDAEHGLNWANVHKQLIPQIIRKGNVYAQAERCKGFFFVLPDLVFQKFEEVVGSLEEHGRPSRDRLSVVTYKLAEPTSAGRRREIVQVRSRHYRLADISEAFVKSISGDAPELLDGALRSIL